MIALVFGAERFHRWVYGSRFNLVTDNKAHVQLLSNSLSRMPARIERLSLRLQQYQYQMYHINRTDNVSDYLIRHSVGGPTEDDKQTEQYINFIVDVAMPKTIKLKQIKNAMMADPVLSKVAEFISSGDWREAHGRSEFTLYDFLGPLPGTDNTCVSSSTTTAAFLS